ncbi:hypothetical protein Mpsy_2416 [Methanolobus psychrophilus R15]|nr:hypothetical protein Mpsy_2416 [Methanolobus psychrophilus R15]
MIEKKSTVEYVSFKGFGEGISENDFSEEQMDILHEFMIIGGDVNQEHGEGEQYINAKICHLQNYLLSHPDFDCKKLRTDILFIGIVYSQVIRGNLIESSELVKEYGISIYPEPTYFTW